jgi:hypothetical protein
MFEIESGYPRDLEKLAAHISQPKFPLAFRQFLFALDHPDEIQQLTAALNLRAKLKSIILLSPIFMLRVTYAGRVACIMNEFDQHRLSMVIPAVILFLLCWMIRNLVWKAWKLGGSFFSSHLSTAASHTPVH